MTPRGVTRPTTENGFCLNRRNWVIIGLLVVGWIIFLGQPTRFSGKLRMVFVQLGTPFVKLGDYFPFVQSRRLLARENEELRRDNDVLRQQVRALDETGRENLRLHQLLDLKEHAAFHTVAARVIGRDASNWWKSIQIDRGSNDGLRENLAILNADGLIGKTISVTKGEARVLLFTDPNCKVSAFLQDTREPGVASGMEPTLGFSPRCVMTYVNRDAAVKPGEGVMSSGLGGVFPKGIRIGTVVRSQLNKQTGMYQDVEIKPSVDFHRLEEVIVILE
jgi:rod shape-determining protein MreC